jgi:hypothetical protein
VLSEFIFRTPLSGTTDMIVVLTLESKGKLKMALRRALSCLRSQTDFLTNLQTKPIGAVDLASHQLILVCMRPDGKDSLNRLIR